MTISELRYGIGREALIGAVIDVVAEEGLDGLSYRKVAQRAGVNNTLISHHFGSKEALLEAATVWAVQRSQQMADLTLASELDKDFAASLTRLVADEPNLQIFQYYMILASRRSPELGRMANNLYESYISLVERFLTHYGHRADRAAARAIFAALDGLVLQQLTVSSRDDIVAAIIRLGELIDHR
ncbi:TetR/AcrR family transcriptional regulator [Sinomonas terrae]|uniref:TetR/AcrR family transcriptional regulator n=1 Tax=Sinomonas terrae TaxID=2908838 RepID=A0ABS9U4F9_9MICC|nr:TetR/AcrR family transcriptional regulator [Sinomonas terrae]MCH6471579.1 TetR/AcrR family transcriptional regulator [Sinomonas terrae]